MGCRESCERHTSPFACSRDSGNAHIVRTVDGKIQAEEAPEQVLEALCETLLHHLMGAGIRSSESLIVRTEEGNRHE